MRPPKRPPHTLHDTALPAPALHDTTALLLAGGQATRMGGLDKGLQLLHGQPLAQHVLARLLAQQGGPLHSVLLNTNRHADQYQVLAQQAHSAAPFGVQQSLPVSVPGVPVRLLADAPALAGIGPLAGFLTGLRACSSPLLLTVPCDTPFLPLDLAQHLRSALLHSGADMAVAYGPDAGPAAAATTTPRRLRSQPVFCLLHTRLAASLEAYVRGGGRKVQAWGAQLRQVHVPFDQPHDAANAFANANTLADLHQLAQSPV